MPTQLLEISPVLPSQDIDRDVDWYKKYVGFKVLQKDAMYGNEKTFVCTYNGTQIR